MVCKFSAMGEAKDAKIKKWLLREVLIRYEFA